MSANASASARPREGHSVEISRLSNGLTLATESMPGLESAAIGVWVKAGVRHERACENGIAHFLEHMAFKGTRTRSAMRIAEEIENVGGDLNASTSVEHTAYFARVLKEDVPLALDLLHDILAHSTFDEEELRRERHVVLQEIGAAQDSPDDLVFDLFQEAAWPDQPIGRPILGTRETLEAFDPDALRTYLSAHYRGPNMLVCAAGAVDHRDVAERIGEGFSQFPSESVSPAPEASYRGSEKLASRDSQETQIVLGFEGRAYHARDFYASQLLAVALGGGMSSRLFQEAREKRGLCYSIHAFHCGFSDTGAFGVSAAGESADMARLMGVILDELHRASEGFSQAEADRARAQIRSALMMSMESPASRAGQLARQMLLFGRPISADELNERLSAISTERLRDLAGRLFSESSPTLAAVGPLDEVMRCAEISERMGVRSVADARPSA